MTRLDPATCRSSWWSGDPTAGVALGEVHGRRAWYLPKPFEVDICLDLGHCSWGRNEEPSKASDRAGDGGAPLEDRGSVIIADDHGLSGRGCGNCSRPRGMRSRRRRRRGDQALAAVAEHQGCVLLLDIAMPGMGRPRGRAASGPSAATTSRSSCSARARTGTPSSAPSRPARAGTWPRTPSRTSSSPPSTSCLRGGTVLSTGVAAEPRRGHPPARLCPRRLRTAAPGAHRQGARDPASAGDAQVAGGDRVAALPQQEDGAEPHLGDLPQAGTSRSRSEAIVKGMELHLIDSKA